MSFTSPFASSSSQPGHGNITVSLLPPSTTVLQTVSYQYPLKLIAPDPLPPPYTECAEIDRSQHPNGSTTQAPELIHTVFLLTYGGGLVAGDQINLAVELAPLARLVLLTQGSTKIFKTPSPDVVSRQHTKVTLSPNSALVYLPDPVQPFAQSAFEQTQFYNLEQVDNREIEGSLCVCDWVTSGRSARGEKWDFRSYKSKNEVWSMPVSFPKDADSSEGRKSRRLLLRDNLILDAKTGRTDLPLAARMNSLSAFGTLIIRGPLFKSLATYFLDEFSQLPRIGGRQWSDASEIKEPSHTELRRLARQKRETLDAVIWSATNVRGFVLVKFAAREVEGARHWLRDMIRDEGSVERLFGERAVLCLR